MKTAQSIAAPIWAFQREDSRRNWALGMSSAGGAKLRCIVRALVALVILFIPSSAFSEETPKPAALELIKQHIDIQLQPDGSYVETRETIFRPLSEGSVQALRHLTLSYTDGFQQLDILSAYTLKPDGTRIDVAQNGILRGYGASSAPGFEDLKTIDVVFPSVEVGDRIAFTTVFRQLRPWFEGKFAADFEFSPLIPTDDASVSISAPENLAVQFDSLGLEAAAPVHANGTVRRTWHYRNGSSAPNESEAVDALDTGPRLVASTFGGYAEVAEIYRRMMHGKADVTPEIKAQADRIIAGSTNRREQARLIYEWVSGHIAYVDVVLGAGGFVPHDASTILKTRYGDCKDHVVILAALLAAEGIVSMPVLISAGNRYKLPKAASPFTFNHLINFVPEFGLYLDSTARYAPFGELPLSDSGKPVLNAMTGEIGQTPIMPAGGSTVKSSQNVTVSSDGSIDGETRVSATGTFAIDTRSVYHLIGRSDEPQFFARVLGPGASGSFERGNIESLSEPYTYSVKFHIPNAVNMPGPAAISTGIGFEPFYPLAMIGGDLPPQRTLPYICPSITAENDLTLNFPKGIAFTSIPAPVSITAEGVSLNMKYRRVGPETLDVSTRVRLDHSAPTCDPGYYARVRPKLAEMIGALRAQVIYQLKGSR